MAAGAGTDADVAYDGSRDLARAVDRLARRLPEPLQPLATIAYNYRWSWTPGGRAAVPRRSARTASGSASENPVRFLRDLLEPDLLAAATDEAYLEQHRARRRRPAARPRAPDLSIEDDGPVAFLCAEFGVHRSLPVYSGGLGVLAGDLLKEASDQALPLVGVGLLYRRGYFHQRMDLLRMAAGVLDRSPTRTRCPPCASPAPDGAPLTVTVPVWDGELSAHVWRADVGRVPLYLLDAEIGENTPLQRWVTARLYEGNRSIRLAQYALLGVGRGARARGDGDLPVAVPPERGPRRARDARRRLERLGLRARRTRHCGEAIERTRRLVRVHDAHPGARGQRDLRPRGDAQRRSAGSSRSSTSIPHEVLALGRTHPTSRTRTLD